SGRRREIQGARARGVGDAQLRTIEEEHGALRPLDVTRQLVLRQVIEGPFTAQGRLEEGDVLLLHEARRESGALPEARQELVDVPRTFGGALALRERIRRARRAPLSRDPLRPSARRCPRERPPTERRHARTQGHDRDPPPGSEREATSERP